MGSWGWGSLSQPEVGSVTYSLSQAQCNDLLGDIYYYSLYSKWVYYDSMGAPHPTPFTLQVGNGSIVAPNCKVKGPDYNAKGTVTDGSGYMLSVSAAPAGTAYARSGTVIQPVIGSQSVYATDANGNQISWSGSWFADTLGTTALTISGSAPNPTTFTYTNPQGNGSSFKMNYTQQTVETNFGCSGVTDYGRTSQITQYLVSEIDLPDSTKYTFTYEGTLKPVHAGAVTGRLASLTLPTGGVISYAYSASGATNNGIVCADGSAALLNRSTPDTGSNPWQYVHSETGTAWTTTITDPEGNQTVMNFQTIYETERQVAGLKTVVTCYNNNPNPCTNSSNSTVIALPITQQTVMTTLGSLTAETNTSYNIYGLPTEVDEYDYGTTLARKTLTSYDTTLGNYIYDRPSTITVENAGGTTASQTSTSYDQTAVTVTSGTPQHVAVSGSRGNPTTVSVTGQNMGGLTRTYAFYDTGNVQTATDVNGGQISYVYNSTGCPNSFPTAVNLPMTLSRSMTWNCAGGVMTELTDENGQPSSYTYNDLNYWRLTAITDQTGATTSLAYYTNPSFAAESTLNFNGSVSTVDTRTTFDGLGRAHITQRQQGQGSASYDSVETDYDLLGRPYQVSVLYGAIAGGLYSGSTHTTTLYDALNRPTLVTDADGGTVASSYSSNDVLVTIGPAPTGENTKQRQLEYNGLGQLTSVCEVTSATGSGTCAQTKAATGFWTRYTYDVLNDLTNVTQNAQSSGTQTRSYTYDGLSRLLSGTNPESGATTYLYDYPGSPCGTRAYLGDLVNRADAVGNVTCYTYDSLHRQTSVTYPSGSYAGVTPAKTFVYDSATVNGVAMANAKGRLAEAYTGNSKTTDLGFSYSARGEVTDVYESTPNSGGYYHAWATYWPNRLLYLLNLQNGGGTVSFVPQITYTPDGEGRAGTVGAGTGQNPVTGTTYPSPLGLPTALNFGSQDSDAFVYDQNTGRTTQYQFTMNGSSVKGGLTWNENGTLQQLAITDPFNSQNQQTCNYGYDDLARLASANCAPKWNQSFAADPFGNLTKTGLGGGAISFQPTYNAATNRVSQVGSSVPGYDADGNLTSDSVHSYSWDSDGNSITIDSVGLTFDALDRVVEQKSGTIYTQIVYSALGNKLALMKGQTLAEAFVPLSGGATAVYNSSGLAYYRHADWLGSSRFASTSTRTLYYDGAYAPYGENYAETGTADRNFTGQNQDTISSGPYPLYDFLRREHHPTWGRWVSPDPAGLAAADPANPQSWNRYAYVLNNPCALVDPFGLATVCTLLVNLTAKDLIGDKDALEKQVEDRIRSMLGADTNYPVAVVFSASNADFTIALLGADPNASAHGGDVYFGLTPNPSQPYSEVYQAQIATELIGSSYQSQLGMAMGTMAVHELTTHALSGHSTVPGSAMKTVNQENSWNSAMMTDPDLKLESPRYVYNKCLNIRKKKPLPPSRAQGGGGGGYDIPGLLCLYFGCTPYPYPPAE